GYRTADQQQVAGDIDFHDVQIFNGAVAHAHVTRHALALEDAARGLALTDGTGGAMRHRVSVGLHAARKVVPLHGALETLADGGAGHIDDLTHLEHVDLDFAAGGEIFAFAFP